MALLGLAECGVLLAIGQQLRASGLMRASDGETAFRVASCLTLPSVILRAMSSGPISSASCAAAAVGAVCMATQAASNWLYCLSRPKRERAVIAGAATGASLHLAAYPLIESVFGVEALQPLVLLDVANHLAVWVGSYLLFATAGAAFPEQYTHEDGGTYRGQWRGMRKEGLGVYAYPGGARYEGEWRDGVKDGRGVYFFPKGGTYEGEWSNGQMSGIGVRTFSTGQVKAGRWKDGRLEAPLELWQCAAAAEGAGEAALAARRVDVGGGTPTDALRHLALQPTLWACLAGILLSCLHLPLPPSLDAVTATLAPANRPLLLLAAGLTLPFDAPSPRVLQDVLNVLSTRLLIPLVMGGTLLFMAAGGGSTAAELAPLAVVVVGLVAPVSPTARQFARLFRLNADLAASFLSTSNLTSLPLMAALCLAAAAAGLGTGGTEAVAAGAGAVAAGAASADAVAAAGMQAVAGTGVIASGVGPVAAGAGTAAAGLGQQGVIGALEATAGALSAGGASEAGLAFGVLSQQGLGLLAGFCLAAAVGAKALATYVAGRYGEEKKVRMVYQGYAAAAQEQGGTGTSGTGGSDAGFKGPAGTAAAAQGRDARPWHGCNRRAVLYVPVPYRSGLGRWHKGPGRTQSTRTLGV